MRHRTRHLHQTLVDYITEQLDALGWITAPVNYGTTAVEVQPFEPFGEGAVQPDGNLVAVTLGDSTEDEDEELGGALISGGYMLYVDVIGVSIPISTAIADDVRLALKNKQFPLKDYTSSQTGVDVAGTHLEFDALEVDVPPAASSVDKRTWRVVSCLVRLYMPDDTLP